LGEFFYNSNVRYRVQKSVTYVRCLDLLSMIADVSLLYFETFSMSEGAHPNMQGSYLHLLLSGFKEKEVLYLFL
jgi:hypothetical protein